MEFWKKIYADTDTYEISNFGNIRKLSRIGARGYVTKGMNIKPWVNTNGYLRVSLKIDGRVKCFYVHQLVAQHFIPNPNKKPNVNHKDGNKLNNKVILDKDGNIIESNLEWCTSSENNKHAFKIGLKKPTVLKGEEHGGRIFDWETINQIRHEYIKGSREYGQCALARKYNTSQSHIWAIVNNKNWKV